MNRLRPLIAVLLSLVLLGAQQVAFAHMIGHIGAAAVHAHAVTEAAEATDRSDPGHREALNLSHVCTTCVSASGLAAGAPLTGPSGLTFDGSFATPAAVPVAAHRAAVLLRYRARAPPAVL
jgi:hypothetical protein